MKSYILSTRQCDFILKMSGIVTVLLFFISRIGSYRIFIIYAIGSLLAGLNLRNKGVDSIFVLAYTYSLYLDFNSGPIFYPSAKTSYFVIVLLTFLLVRYLIARSFKRIISAVTQNQYFVECPSCHFNNVNLVESCTNCDYKNGDRLVISPATISSSVRGDKIPFIFINMLNLGEKEEILFYKHLGLFTRKLKNGKNILSKHLLITSGNLLLINSTGFYIRSAKSWTKKDIIPLSHIASIQGKMKYYLMYKVRRPFLIIKSTQNDIYEIALSTFSQYVTDINEITAIIKKINPQTTIQNDLIGDDSGYDERDKRLLLLLPLILLLLALVLWRLIQYVRISGLN